MIGTAQRSVGFIPGSVYWNGQRSVLCDGTGEEETQSKVDRILASTSNSATTVVEAISPHYTIMAVARSVSR